MKLLVIIGVRAWRMCRSPCGERGLKSLILLCNKQLLRSLPVRGAWVEIEVEIHMQTDILSLPVRGAWVEIY